ncbi:MAG: efflux transporter periplasmic adaptor subunit [Planctomycetaceae bacterium]|nr:efflux transporter periplasmic adaptor subunit [Planctomycetaceae bacterium]
MAAVLAGCDSVDQKRPPAAPAVVTVATPVTKQIVEWDSYTARLEPVEFVEVRARVSGYLQSIHFSEGQLVEEGDLLFVIDPRQFEAALDSAEATLEEARAQLSKATASMSRAEAQLVKAIANRHLTERRVQRARSVRAQNAVTEEEVDIREGEYLQAKADVEGTKAAVAEAKAAITAASAAVETAKASVRTAELNLSYTKIRAPIAGRISDHRVTDGNLISGGSAQSTLLTTITSLDPIHCTFDASEAEVLKYTRLSQAGTRESAREIKFPVYLALADEEGFPHVGHIDFVDNRFDPDSATMRAKAIFPNSNINLVPGLFATLRIPGSGSHEAVLIPDEAVGTDQSQQFVLVVDDEKKVDLVVVELGPIVNGLRVVRSGLAGDEQVVTRGLQRVRPGATVNPEVETLQVVDDGLPDSYEPIPREDWLTHPPDALPSSDTQEPESTESNAEESAE